MRYRAYGWVHTEDVSAKFSAVLVESDYGVPRSPTFWEPEDITLEYVEVLGCELPLDRLTDKLESAIYDLVDEIEDWDGE